MKRIGLTGGIGSGKTTVSKVFAALGVPVFYADEAGREVLDDDPEVRKAVVKLLGRSAYFEDGRANRKEIGSVVFRHPELLEALSAIVHPAVGRAWDTFKRRNEAAAYVVKEVAILFESGSDKDMDAVIAVSAPEDLRINRVMARDGSTREEVLDRIKRQLSEEERIQRSHHIIVNDGTQPLLEQVLELDAELRQLNPA